MHACEWKKEEIQVLIYQIPDLYSEAVCFALLLIGFGGLDRGVWMVDLLMNIIPNCPGHAKPPQAVAYLQPYRPTVVPIDHEFPSVP